MRAMADVEKSAVAVRKNMERLRALRQAKEAEDASALPAATEISEEEAQEGCREIAADTPETIYAGCR